jgi:hypothetical protein
VRKALLNCEHSRTVWMAPSWNPQGLSSVALNSSTLNVEGRRPSVASTLEGHLRSLEIESLAVRTCPRRA